MVLLYTFSFYMVAIISFVFYYNRQHARLEDRQLIACKEYFQNRSGRHTNEFLSSLTMKRDVKGKGDKIRNFFHFRSYQIYYIYEV